MENRVEFLVSLKTYLYTVFTGKDKLILRPCPDPNAITEQSDKNSSHSLLPEMQEIK